MRINTSNLIYTLAVTKIVTAVITLSPEPLPAVHSGNSESSAETNKDTNDWYLLPDNSNLVCDKRTGESCHPLMFEPESEWKEILPLQQIPPGLNVRINFETGKKEARISESEGVADLSAETDQQDGSDVHEFTAMFEKLMKNENVEETLEELIDFSHDFKHGFKIIQNEQNFIISQLSRSDVADSVKDLYLRLLTSCLRNNPPAKGAFFIKNVDFIVSSIPQWIEEDKSLLLKRSINILQNVAYKASPNGHLLDNLEALYTATTDLGNKLKILEIFADLEILTDNEAEDIGFYFNPVQKSLVKRNLENKPNLDAWFREYCDKIQLDAVDDFYLEKFLKTLVKFKTADSTLKANDDFIKWIAEESMKRYASLEENKTQSLESRDLEHESFNKEFIRIRHEIFGNKMAARIKMPLDEL